MTEVFRGFPLSLKAGVVPQTWLRTLLSTSFPLHYVLIILSAPYSVRADSVIKLIISK
jgi:hypothetical protein